LTELPRTQETVTNSGPATCRGIHANGQKQSTMFLSVHVPRHTQLMEEIGLKIFGCPDLSVSLIDLLSDGDTMNSRENSFEIWGTPVNNCLIWTGTSVKTCWKFWQS